MDEDVSFGELRSLLQQAPSARLWRTLCALVDGWSDEGFEHVALDYALNHLRGWPDALRQMPAAWLDALARGEDEPRALLCDVLAPPRWPVGVRAPAPGWIDASGQGAHHPCLALCDHLWFDADILPADAAWYAELFASARAPLQQQLASLSRKV